MKRLATVALWCVMACAPLAATHAADKPNVLVMGEDAAEHGPGAQAVVVARDTRVFKQVLEAIGDELSHEGFNVYDERAITLDTFKQNRTGRGEAELLDIARSVQKPPMDAVVIFTVYAGARKLAYTTDVYTRISGRIVNVRTGQKLGAFEVNSPAGWRAPATCESDCLLEVLARNAGAMGGDLGAVLGEKLQAAAVGHGRDAAPARTPLPTGYTLTFTGFGPDEISDVEEYLVAFKGYKLHRPVSAAPRNAQYWYEIDSDSARLNRNLRMMLDRIGANGRVTYSGTDNSFTVEKITAAKAP